MDATGPSASEPAPESVKAAEAALARLGYLKVAHDLRSGPTFWVQETARPRRTFPVYLWDGASGSHSTSTPSWSVRNPADGAPGRAILVVPSAIAAEAALGRGARRDAVGGELRVLIVPHGAHNPPAPHWHALVLTPRELLEGATGVVVGLFRRAQASEGSSEIDFSEMLTILKRTFRIDLHASLGVESDEAALFLLYQLAQRYAFAPGDPGANLHTLVLRPTGPAARLPWFAA